MVIRRVMLLGLVLAGLTVHAQETPKKKAFKPDFPGSLQVEFGFNFKNGITPPEYQASFWGSRTFNVYYHYPLRLFRSKISFNPGIGLSLERWKFSNNYTLAYAPDANGTYPLVPAAASGIAYPGEINRSQLVNNYVEAPIEFRFDTTPEDIARSFSLSVGARFGVLYDSFTKIEYEDGGQVKKIKDKQNHGMNRYRTGIYARMGIGGFGFFGYWNMSPMFEEGKGPIQTKMNSVTIGISINGF